MKLQSSDEADRLLLARTEVAIELAGEIVKLPKKGNMINGNNWQRITLLSIPSKVFCIVLLNGLCLAMDATFYYYQWHVHTASASFSVSHQLCL